MKILIIYGGNGLADDLSLTAIKRICTVLTELEVEVKQYNLTYTDITEEITEELQSSEGVILATTVDWIGIGGRMQTFLDQCNKFNNQFFSNKYLMSVVLTKKSGDRDASNYLLKCWDMLGGIEGVNICGKIEKFIQLETDENVLSVIDKKTEDFYRIIRQKRKVLPIGTITVTTSVINENTHNEDAFTDMNIIDEYVGDTNNSGRIIEEDPYIIEQKQDIKEISDFLEQQLNNKTTNLSGNKYIDKFLETFICENSSFACTYNIIINDQQNNDIILRVKDNNLAGFVGTDTRADVVINIESNVLDEILKGNLTIQRGFLTGKLKAKGNFTQLYELDNIFRFTYL